MNLGISACKRIQEGTPATTTINFNSSWVNDPPPPNGTTIVGSGALWKPLVSGTSRWRSFHENTAQVKTAVVCNSGRREPEVRVEDQGRHSRIQGRPDSIAAGGQQQARGCAVDATAKCNPPTVGRVLHLTGQRRKLADAENSWPVDLLERIKGTVKAPAKLPRKPEFQFKMDSNSAGKDFSFLVEHGLGLSRALIAQEGSPLGYGSEFKLTYELESVFNHHPNWNRMKLILNEGSDWPMEKLSEEERLSDLKEALLFGNHKGANNNQELLRKLVENYVVHGHGLVIPLDKLEDIPGVLVAPMKS